MKEELPSDLGKILLELGSIVLMESLIKRIEANKDKSNSLGERLLSNNYKEIEYVTLSNTDRLNEKQILAINGSLKNDISYIWGPPGTGKTSVIARIINELQTNNKTVLITSHTNSAVDTALKKSFDNFKKNNKNKNDSVFLRYGETTDVLKTDEKYKELTPEYHKQIIGKHLYERKAVVEKEMSILKIGLDEIEFYKSKSFDDVNKYYNEYNNYSNEKEKIKHIISSKILDINEVFKNKDGLKYKDYLGKVSNYCEELQLNNHNLSKLKNDYSHYKNEINNFLTFENLNKKLKSFGDINQIKLSYETVNRNLQALSSSNDSLKEKDNINKSEIDAYNSYGAIKKFLMGNNYVSHREKEIEDNYKLEEENNRKIDANLKNRLLIEKQLFDIDSLKNEINAIKTSNSKEFWNEKLNNVENEINKISNKILFLNNKIDAERENAKSNVNENDLLKYTSLDKQVFDLSQKYYSIKFNCDDLKIKLQRLSEIYDYAFCTATDFLLRIEQLISKKQELSESYLNVSDDELNKIAFSKKDEYDELQKELTEINNELDKLDSQVIKNAQVIGTTLTKTYLSNEIQDRQFDTIIIDETSMAQIPAIWCAAYLVATNIIFVGDFLQISPIVISKNDIALKWLGNSIYKHNEIDTKLKNIETRTSIGNFYKLNNQYRMEKDIADLSDINYKNYDDEGLITKASDVRDREFEKFKHDFDDETKPWTNADKPIKIIDTKGLNTWSSINANGSKLNFYNATLVTRMAFDLLDKKLSDIDKEINSEQIEPNILIITPYKAQVKLIRKIIDSESEKLNIKYLDYINAGTIHSFQGKQSDIVIFDLTVDNPDHSNKFISPKLNESTMRECNVATTRAKFSLFIVCNLNYFDNKAPKSTYIYEYIKNAKMLAQTFKAEEIYPKLKYFERDINVLPNDVKNMIVTSGIEYYKYLYNDIRNSKNRVIICSAFLGKQRITEMLPEIDNAINRNVKVILITKSTELATMPAATKECEDILTKHRVKIFHKGNMHEKLVFIDNNLIWCGSLNTMSFNGTTGELMTRVEDKNVFDVYASAIELDKIVDSKSLSFCPACGSKLISNVGRFGLYYECKNCGYRRNDNSIDIINGLPFCKKCNTQMSYDKNKSRWVCANKHYKDISKNELKIESVLSLIPKTELNKVIEKNKINMQEIWPNFKVTTKTSVSPFSTIVSTRQTSLFTSAQNSIKKKNSLTEYLENNNIAFIDNRKKNGSIWIKGGRELEPVVCEIKKQFKITFTFRPQGGKYAFKGQPAWWAR